MTICPLAHINLCAKLHIMFYCKLTVLIRLSVGKLYVIVKRNAQSLQWKTESL
jgi:hypothetical protein